LLILQTYLSLGDETRAWTRPAHLFTGVAQLFRAWVWAALTPFVFALRREILRRHRSRLVIAGLHLLAALALLAWVNVVRVWLIEFSYGYWELEMFSVRNVYRFMNARTVIDFYLYWVVLAAGYGYDLLADRRRTGLREEQLRTALAQAELAALRQQVQPHFLFNSLNAISALMREGHTARAIEALALLSTLLRQLMHHAGQPEIELRRELDYAHCYLALEKIRFEEKLVTRFEAEEDCLSALVPTLILQPLIENAVKHGIAQRRNPGCLTVAARRHEGRLLLEVANDPAEGGRQAREADNHGIGLNATRSRLGQAYGTEHRLAFHFGTSGQRSVVSLELPLRLAPVLKESTV
jgi:signal transduction histidine kinase